MLHPNVKMPLYNFCVVFNLSEYSLDCRVCLLPLEGEVSWISVQYSYAIVIKEVEWIDIRAFRELLWQIASGRRYSNLSMLDETCRKDEQEATIKSVRIIARDTLRHDIMDIILSQYINNYCRSKYVTYELYVRYEDNSISEKNMLDTEQAFKVISRRIREMTYEPSTCVLL